MVDLISKSAVFEGDNIGDGRRVYTDPEEHELSMTFSFRHLAVGDAAGQRQDPNPILQRKRGEQSASKEHMMGHRFRERFCYIIIATM